MKPSLLLLPARLLAGLLLFLPYLAFGEDARLEGFARFLLPTSQP